MVDRSEDLTENRHLHAFIDEVRSYELPVISVYAAVDPSQRETLSHPTLVRVRNALRDLQDVPDGVRERIVEHFATRAPQGRSVAVFANREHLQSLELNVALPNDGVSDHVDARVGEPYITPLLSVMSERGAHLVVFADRDHVRVFRVLLGQAEQLLDATRDAIADEQDEIGQSKDRFPQGVSRVAAPNARSPQTVGNQQNKPKYIADRGDAAKQLKDERVEHSQSSFYRENALHVQALLQQYEVERVLVLGPERDRHLFVAAMPHELSKRVAALLPSSDGKVPAPHEVLTLVGSKIEELEAQGDAQLLDTIADRGVLGVEECLVALQEGRVHQLAVPVSLTHTAYLDPTTEYVTAKKQQAAALGEQQAEAIDLAAKLPELAEKWGAQIEFVTGEQERRVLDEFGGLGGLKRW